MKTFLVIYAACAGMLFVFIKVFIFLYNQFKNSGLNVKSTSSLRQLIACIFFPITAVVIFAALVFDKVMRDIGGNA